MTRPITDFTTLSFDCYGTLIDWESGIGAALEPWLRRNGVEAGREEILAAYSEAEPRHETLTPAALYPDILRAVMGDMAAKWGISLDPADADAFAGSVADWPAFPDSSEALAYLKRHYKLAILSNIDRESFRHSNEKLDVEFDLIVTAQDVGSYKPDVRNFQYLFDELAAMGVARESLLHVAESLHHDHVPGQRLGLTTVWVNRHFESGGFGATKAPDMDVTPDYQVPSMAALAEMHRGLTGG